MVETEDILGTIVTLEFFFTAFIGISLLFYGIGRDYIIYPIYEAVGDLVTGGVMGAWVLDIFDGVNNVFNAIPPMIDKLFLLLFVMTALTLISSSYYAGRNGWFSNLGFLTVGIMLSFFVMGIVTQFSTWFRLNFTNKILPDLVYSVPIYNWYISYSFYINFFIILLCIIASFVDLDFQGFFTQKNKEDFNDEVG